MPIDSKLAIKINALRPLKIYLKIIPDDLEGSTWL